MLFVPPYGPEINPIEDGVAKLKALLKRAAAKALEQLWDASPGSSRPTHPCMRQLLRRREV